MMTLNQALEIFEKSKWMRIHKKSAMIVLDFDTCVEARVRRKTKESFEAMLLRCAQKAQERKVAAWKNPAVFCGACGCQAYHLYPVAKIGLRLCKECAIGVGELAC